MRWEGPPTWRDEPSGRVKGTEGKGLQEKKGANKRREVGKLDEETSAARVSDGEEDGRRANTAPNKEGGDVVIGMGEEG